MKAFSNKGVKTLIECGPNKILTSLAKRTLPSIQTISLDSYNNYLDIFNNGWIIPMSKTINKILVTVGDKTNIHTSQFGSNKAFYLDGVENEYLKLKPGKYIFDQSHYTNKSYRLSFFINDNTEYTNNVKYKIYQKISQIGSGLKVWKIFVFFF